MSIASRIRRALPLRLQPAARFHYERWRGLLERELPLFCELIGPNERVLDIGANFGVYVHALRQRGARVEAFEPQPACLEVLRAYAAADPLVRVHDVALGARESIAELEVPVVQGRPMRGMARLMDTDRPIATTAPGEGRAAGSERIATAVRPLDAFGFSDVRGVKIDVEGAELEVIAGAVETFERCRPLLLMEVEQRHHRGPVEEVFARMAALGYDASFFLPGGGLRSIRDFRVELHQSEQALAGGAGLYINNFLFRPREGGTARSGRWTT